ncbi:MAG: hypothetical protein KKA79_10360 [Nanoarchaeota archaeon]|nr:hypothetical protein [Nanoarchaeota archaeon]MCG2718932.1 hypothetical protein [Nanoarchaeota archaeon]
MKKKKKMSKKGISPMIATVLLIGFIISIILLILLWGRDYIEELAEKKGALAEKQNECTKVSLDVVKACWTGDTAEIVIRNKANTPIHKFIFRAVGKEGSPVEKVGKDWTLGSLETKSYDGLKFPTDVGKINNMDIIPHLRVALGHYVPCSKQKITARLTGNC